VRYDYLGMGMFQWGYSQNKVIFRFISTRKEKLNRRLITKPSSTPFKPNKILQNYLFQKFEIANF